MELLDYLANLDSITRLCKRLKQAWRRFYSSAKGSFALRSEHPSHESYNFSCKLAMRP